MVFILLARTVGQTLGKIGNVAGLHDRIGAEWLQKSYRICVKTQGCPLNVLLRKTHVIATKTKGKADFGAKKMALSQNFFLEFC